jgi:hypothetical protein
MTMPRRQLVDVAVTRYYHCISRCVRRAFLCGEGVTHRKAWIEARLELLASVRTPQPHLTPLIASAGGPFPSATEAMHGTWRGSEEAGCVAAAAIAI